MRRVLVGCLALGLLVAPLAHTAPAAAAPSPTAWTCDINGSAVDGQVLAFVSTTATCAGQNGGFSGLATYNVGMFLPGGGPSPCTAVRDGDGSLSMVRSSLVFGTGPARIDGGPHMTRIGLSLRLSGGASTGAEELTLTGHLELMPASPLACASANPTYLVTGTLTFTEAAATTAAS